MTDPQRQPSDHASALHAALDKLLRRVLTREYTGAVALRFNVKDGGVTGKPVLVTEEQS